MCSCESQRHAIPPRRHRKSQKSALAEARTNHGEGVQRQQKRNIPQFVKAEIKQAQMVGAIDEEAVEGRALLDAGKGEDSEAHCE